MDDIKFPILFLIFNRPEETRRVFEEIRNYKPSHLYIAADGPRAERGNEVFQCNEARQVVDLIDWPCETYTLFRNENLGCKIAVSQAISWFFECEEAGIILEDDCLPNPDFFTYCSELLEFYKNDDRIMAITGDNFQHGKTRGNGSYYFSKIMHIWGWATWRRAWVKYDVSVSFWNDWKKSSDWLSIWKDPIARKFWEKILDSIYRNEIDTWDYQWTACIWYHGGLTITPNVNLVSNIGFGVNATHTTSVNNSIANMVTEKLHCIVHPSEIYWNSEADSYAFDHALGGLSLRWPLNILLPLKKILRIIRGYLG